MSVGLVSTPGAVSRCECGSDIASGILACPGCRRLVHAEALKGHRTQAEAAAQSGDRSSELAAWRAALSLVPQGSRQYTAIAERIDALSEATLAAPSSGPAESVSWKWFGAAGTAGLLLWKFKFLIVALLTKGKLLLLGLTKASTAFSMLLSFGVYWTAWGMWFALGVVLSIYVHEMGHIAALRRFGIPATAPMFVPGLGAFIRLRTQRLSPREDARIGLAGPIWGLAAAGIALGVGFSGGGGMWMAIARTGAWINAFNLLPVWQLDGNRGIAAISRRDRWLIVAAFAGGWMIAGDGLFALLALTAIVRAVGQDAPESSDRAVLAQFGLVTVALAALFRLAG